MTAGIQLADKLVQKFGQNVFVLMDLLDASSQISSVSNINYFLLPGCQFLIVGVTLLQTTDHEMFSALGGVGGRFWRGAGDCWL